MEISIQSRFKSEIRISKSETNSNYQNLNDPNTSQVFRSSFVLNIRELGFWICFVLRISHFDCDRWSSSVLSVSPWLVIRYIEFCYRQFSWLEVYALNPTIINPDCQFLQILMDHTFYVMPERSPLPASSQARFKEILDPGSVPC